MTRITDPPLLIGLSRGINELRQAILRAARTDAKVLITGESGAGKEVVARHVYAASQRSHCPFITVNCGSLAETLLESELFGHVRGSFTGAHRDKPGKLELADGGTVFLDEIGETTPRMQVLLLRMLETGEIQTVGGSGLPKRVDVRTISATNRNLRELVAQGTFREDLFYRLNVVTLAVPALRDRKDDIPALAQHFLQQPAFTQNRGPLTITPEAMNMLVEYRWPGNVRELQNVIERIVVHGRCDAIGVDDMPPEVRPVWNPAPQFAERRRSIVDDLYRRLVEDQQSFWTAVYPLFMRREIPRDVVRDVVRRGLEDARGNYKVVARMFNLRPEEYKKFLNFLRKHECQPPFRAFRPALDRRRATAK
ncbi:MAG: zraR 10 [Acidobacteria bacterium]|nr:zraR 10 [Acidobacteriota bacterium]